MRENESKMGRGWERGRDGNGGGDQRANIR